MNLNLPSRVPLTYAFLFAASLFLAQQMEHTSLYFSVCSFLFVMVAALGFNIGGGLTRPSGTYLFFFSVLACITGLTAKAFLGEPADSHLTNPHLTITVYLVGLSSMTAAVFVVRKLGNRKPLLGSLVTDNNMYQAAIGCLAIGLVLDIATHTVQRGAGSTLSALSQINRFTELGIILAVIHTARRTGGRSSLDPASIFGCAVLFVTNGLLSFSKEGFFGPFACWGTAAAAAGLRLRRGQIVVLVLSVLFVTRYMVPYSQYGRVYAAPTFFANIAVAERLLSNIGEVRATYEATSEETIPEGSAGSYYDHPEGILDRFQMISVDDLLINVTYLRGPIGYFPIVSEFANVIPHVFWPDKPTIMWGNYYAHEAGVPIGDEDFTTGISFSPVSEAYHVGGWVGLLVLAPAIWVPCLLIFEILCGDVRQSPWGLLLIVFFAHLAPEGYLAGIIYAAVYITFAITFAALATGYLMPIIGSLIIGPGRRTGSGGQGPLAVRTRARPLVPATSQPGPDTLEST